MSHLHPRARTARALLAITLALLGPAAGAATAQVIDARADAALERFYEQVDAGRALAREANGLLIFPRVIKAGFFFGGEYGEGALRVDGETVQYYSVAAGSFGLQLGAQAKVQILMFMTPESLSDFRASDGWEIGVDGNVALVKVGTGGSVNTNNVKQPVIGFVLTDRGLMYDLSLKGAKISRIER